jgi:hypothetical protein
MSISTRFGKPDWPRFLKYVEKQADGCWLWVGAIRGNGRNEYGAFWCNGTQRAHIVSYVWTYGEPNADLHHICGNSLCANPEHLTPAAAGQPRHRNVIPGLCAKGHPFDGVNSRGERTCSVCLNENSRRHYERNREKVNAAKRQRRRARGEIKVYEPRPCEVCGTMFTPKRVGPTRGRLCHEPDPADEMAHRKWRDCMNRRQKRSRDARLERADRPPE